MATMIWVSEAPAERHGERADRVLAAAELGLAAGDQVGHLAGQELGRVGAEADLVAGADAELEHLGVGQLGRREVPFGVPRLGQSRPVVTVHRVGPGHLGPQLGGRRPVAGRGPGLGPGEQFEKGG